MLTNFEPWSTQGADALCSILFKEWMPEFSNRLIISIPSTAGVYGVPSKMDGRRPASYWFKEKRTGTAQADLFAEEQRDDLPLVNALREDVKRWRESGYRGASAVTRDLLRWWSRDDAPRRLFFCQREAVETLIYLLELRIPGRSSRSGFKKFECSDEDIARMLQGESPQGFDLADPKMAPSLVDQPADDSMLPLSRLGCKMATVLPSATFGAA